MALPEGLTPLEAVDKASRHDWREAYADVIWTRLSSAGEDALRAFLGGGESAFIHYATPLAKDQKFQQDDFKAMYKAIAYKCRRVLRVPNNG